MTRRLPLAVLGLHLLVLAAHAQGVLIPENTRIAPFPRPVPGPHPLAVASLRVETRVQNQVATTRVTQVFRSDLDFVVDGTYFYPLPEDATFVEFATWDGDKRLRGEVLERQEARNRYLAIVRRSWDPGLLEYAGANLFQARVFPVPPRGEKKIEFAYSQVLRADHGLVGYRYPLSSGSQANPQPIGTVAVTVEIESEQGLKAIYSPTHALDVRRDGERRARLGFEATTVRSDRDFQLAFGLSNADFGLSLLAHREAGEDGTFMLLLAPKVEVDAADVLPKDIVFVLDTSGSMQERGKIEKARAALRFGVGSLQPADRFAIVTFSTDTRRFRDGLVPASEAMREAARQFIDRQQASGGTNIADALSEALAGFEAGNRLRYVVFLTDGLPTVGETDAGRILSATASLNPLHARIFTFGVGYDVNTFLLDQLAARNGGAADYITPDEDLEVKLSNFFARVSSPVMSDLALDLGPMQALEVYPKQLPDLFRGTQITLLGRYTGSGSVALTLRGRVRGQARTLRFEARPLPAVSADNDFLPRLWAMRKVGFLLEQIRISGESAELKNEIVRLAKKYGFVTPYTSMLAADEKDLFSGARPPDAVPLQTRDAGLGGLKPAAPAREAVAASIALGSMKRAEVAAAGQPAPWPGTRQAGGKTFADRAGVWTDTAYDPAAKLPVVELGFASDALLQALAADRRLAAYAAIGRNVVVVHLGKVYRIRG